MLRLGYSFEACSCDSALSMGSSSQEISQPISKICTIKRSRARTLLLLAFIVLVEYLILEDRFNLRTLQTIELLMELLFQSIKEFLSMRPTFLISLTLSEPHFSSRRAPPPFSSSSHACSVPPRIFNVHLSSICLELLPPKLGILRPPYFGVIESP